MDLKVNIVRMHTLSENMRCLNWSVEIRTLLQSTTDSLLLHPLIAAGRNSQHKPVNVRCFRLEILDLPVWNEHSASLLSYYLVHQAYDTCSYSEQRTKIPELLLASRVRYVITIGYEHAADEAASLESFNLVS